MSGDTRFRGVSSWTLQFGSLWGSKLGVYYRVLIEKNLMYKTDKYMCLALGPGPGRGRRGAVLHGVRAGRQRAGPAGQILPFILWVSLAFIEPQGASYGELKLSVGSGIDDIVTPNPVPTIETVHFENPTDRLSDCPTGS